MEGDVVLRPVEAVTLVGEDHIGDRDLLLLHGRNDQIALRQSAAHVIGAMADQHGLFDLVHLVERRTRAQKRAPLFGLDVGIAAIELLHEIGPVRRPVLHQRDKIGDPDHGHGATEHLGCEGGADERRIAPVRPAHDSNLVSGCDALADRPLDPIDQVVMDLARVLLVAGVDEGFAEARRGPVVDGEHGIAAIGEPLVIAVVAVGVAPPWATVDVKHHRPRLAGTRAGLVRGQCQVGDQVEAVARFDARLLHAGQSVGLELGTGAEQLGDRAGLAVHKVVGCGLLRSPDSRDPARVVAATAADRIIGVRHMRLDLVERGAGRRIDCSPYQAPGIGSGRSDLEGLLVYLHVDDIGIGALSQHRLRPGLGIDSHHRRGIATQRREHGEMGAGAVGVGDRGGQRVLERDEPPGLGPAARKHQDFVAPLLLVRAPPQPRPALPVAIDGAQPVRVLIDERA